MVAAMIELHDCRCVSGAKCIPMPNRFRKAMSGCDWYGDKPDAKEDADSAKAKANEAIAAEFGPGLEAAFCVSMQPVVVRWAE
jgi:hypothetical protein